MIIFCKGSFFVEGTANGGLRFSGGDMVLHDEEVPALIEAIRTYRSKAIMTGYFDRRAKMPFFENTENPKAVKD